MKAISEITRRDCFDLLPNPWSGRVSEVELVGKLVDLDNLPSEDSRFETFRGDLFQHQVRNDDWERDWILSDSRVGLDEDQKFLRFIEAVLDPNVLSERNAGPAIAERLNRVLLPDGFKLVVADRVSGHPVFKAVAVTPRVPPQQTEIPASIIAVTAESLASVYSHTALTVLFEKEDAPRPSNEGGNKIDKCRAWLRAANTVSDCDPCGLPGKNWTTAFLKVDSLAHRRRATCARADSPTNRWSRSSARRIANPCRRSPRSTA